MFALVARYAHGSAFINDLDLSEPTPSASLSYVTAVYVPSFVLKASNSLQDASKDKIRVIITSSALKYGVDPDLMIRIAMCESGLRVEAKNSKSTASSLFQWLDSSFQRYATKYGITGNKNDPYVQSDLTAQVLANGGIGNWSESRSCWTRT